VFGDVFGAYVNSVFGHFAYEGEILAREFYASPERRLDSPQPVVG
jgi:hypothetical protein